MGEFIILVVVVLIVYIAQKESSHRDKIIDELQEKIDKDYSDKFCARFKEVHGLDYLEVYESPEYKDKWDKLNYYNWHPTFDSFVEDGLFSENEELHFLDIMNDEDYEELMRKKKRKSP